HDHGIITFPLVPDPITYTLTASDGTCAFYDEMVLTVLNAPTSADHHPAGEDGCGPRFVGHEDVTPFLNETYLWTKLAGSTGSGSFIGATDTSLTTVSASVIGTDIYELAISANSTTCRDTVAVPQCGGCAVDVEAEDGNCALGTGITLTATGASANYTYSWLPSTGLSSSTGSSVQVLDNVNRTYTVTATSTIDPSHSCSESIEVSNPAWSYPVFTAQDGSGCDGDIVNIGDVTVAGYTYSWEYDDAIVSTLSDPAIVVGASTAGIYTVTVTDAATGCFTMNTATVELENVIADAGPDYTVCSNAYLTLGTADPSGGDWDYLWTPASNWQNGTDSSSAQPEVEVFASIDYTVTVTNPATGCEATDIMSVTFDANPSIIDAPDAIVCLGSSVQIGNPAIAGVIYSWVPSATLDDATAAQPMASPLSTTNYTLTAFFPPYTCANNPTDAVEVTVLDPSFDLGPNLTDCPGSGGVSIGANAPTTGVSSYSWSPATNLSNASIANPTA
ncbi:MAG: hypothetical protein GY753_04730, partial [Gammaproteobacteria bacterium]|nr:hypothetical protein [Gammaproteobacteria bacterium]